MTLDTLEQLQGYNMNMFVRQLDARAENLSKLILDHALQPAPFHARVLSWALHYTRVDLHKYVQPTY